MAEQFMLRSRVPQLISYCIQGKGINLSLLIVQSMSIPLSILDSDLSQIHFCNFSSDFQPVKLYSINYIHYIARHSNLKDTSRSLINAWQSYSPLVLIIFKDLISQQMDPRIKQHAWCAWVYNQLFPTNSEISSNLNHSNYSVTRSLLGDRSWHFSQDLSHHGNHTTQIKIQK